MSIFDVLTMLGGLCLFLFGMTLMGQALERRAGGLSPFLAAFFGGRKLTPAQAEELKELIDRTTWEG